LPEREAAVTQGSASIEPAHPLFFVAWDTGCVLMPHDGRIGHLHGRVMSGGRRIHDLVPDASPSQANEAVAHGIRYGRTSLPGRPKNQIMTGRHLNLEMSFQTVRDLRGCPIGQS
jgi:hypothetical protein